MSTKTTPAPTTIVSLPNDGTALGSDFTSGHGTHDIQKLFAAGDQTPGGHPPRDSHRTTAAGSQAAQSHRTGDDQDTTALGPILADPVLGMLADVVDDLESVRCANENRVRQLTDISERGHGLTLQHPEIARLAAIVADLQAAEHQAILNLQRVMRAHPLGLWTKPIAGVGDKQLARLLAVIGDPYWNDLHDRPRTVSELWAFCGYHVITSGGHSMRDNQAVPAAGSNVHTGQVIFDAHLRTAGVAPKRQRGQKSNWNEDARKRCYLIATSCIKQAQSPYRKVYDDTRAKYADAVHTAPCVRCGPKGKPTPEGSALSLAHQHARGLRAVSKAFLKDLWREAKRIHESAVEEIAS